MRQSVGREQFEETCNEALTIIGNALATVTSEFGPNDFPDDFGITFRNKVFGYSYGWFEAAKHYIYEEPNDECRQNTALAS